DASRPADPLLVDGGNGYVDVPLLDQRWSFTTSGTGDFEALVRRLRPIPAPSGVGVRVVDASVNFPESDFAQQFFHREGALARPGYSAGRAGPRGPGQSAPPGAGIRVVDNPPGADFAPKSFHRGEALHPPGSSPGRPGAETDGPDQPAPITYTNQLELQQR